jgi:hypothetical protein
VGKIHDYGWRLRRLGTVVLVISAAGLTLGACSSGNGNAASKTTTTTAASSAKGTGHTSTTIASSATTTIPFSVSQVQHGTGPASLANFTVASSAKEWDIDWEYDCSATPTKKGSFTVTVVGHGSASDTTDIGVPQQSGVGTAGIAKNYDDGTFNLNVATPCKWTVRVETFT